MIFSGQPLSLTFAQVNSDLIASWRCVSTLIHANTTLLRFSTLPKPKIVVFKFNISCKYSIPKKFDWQLSCRLETDWIWPYLWQYVYLFTEILLQDFPSRFLLRRKWTNFNLKEYSNLIRCNEGSRNEPRIKHLISDYDWSVKSDFHSSHCLVRLWWTRTEQVSVEIHTNSFSSKITLMT